MKKMTIDDFIKVTHDEVEAFKKYYLSYRDSAERKGDWPLSMSEGDWYEQFMMWQQLSGLAYKHKRSS